MAAFARYQLIALLILCGLLVQACGSAPTTATESQPATAAATTANETAPPESTTTSETTATTETATAVEGASATVGAATETNTERVSLKVVTLPFISLAPFHIAYEEGFFAEQGLDVELVNMTVQRDIVPALASGQVDVASGLLSAGIFNTIAKDAKIQIVADKGYTDPDGCANIAVIAGRSLHEAGVGQNPESLRGQTLSIVRSSWVDYYADKAFQEVGLTVEDMQLTDIPSPTQQEALEQGQVDMVVNNEPWVTRFGKAGHKPILTPVHELLPNSQNAVTLYGSSLLGENSDVGNRFMVAYLRAVRQYNEGKTDRNIEILAKHIKLEPQLLREMCWPALRDDGQIDVPSTLDFQKWAQEKKFMDTVVPLEQFWNPSFIEYANEQLGATR